MTHHHHHPHPHPLPYPHPNATTGHWSSTSGQYNPSPAVYVNISGGGMFSGVPTPSYTVPSHTHGHYQYNHTSNIYIPSPASHHQYATSGSTGAGGGRMHRGTHSHSYSSLQTLSLSSSPEQSGYYATSLAHHRNQLPIRHPTLTLSPNSSSNGLSVMAGAAAPPRHGVSATANQKSLVSLTMAVPALSFVPSTPNSYVNDTATPHENDSEAINEPDSALTPSAATFQLTTALATARLEVETMKKQLELMEKLKLDAQVKEYHWKEQASNYQKLLTQQQQLRPSPLPLDNDSGDSNNEPLTLPTLSVTQHMPAILTYIAPTRSSEQRRLALLSWLKALIRKSLGAQCYATGNYALKTYLNDDPIDVSAFFSRAHESSWLQRIVNALCTEAYNSGSASNDSDVVTPSSVHVVQKVTVTFHTAIAPSYVTCMIGNTPVNIYGNDVSSLASLALFEQCDRTLGAQHLFKRTVLLVQAWAVRHRVYGNNDSDSLLTPLFLRTLVLMIINLHYTELSPTLALATPLDLLVRLLRYLKHFDWDRCALTVFGPVSLTSIETSVLEPVTTAASSCPIDAIPLVSVDTIKAYQNHSITSTNAESGGSAMARVNSMAFLIPDGTDSPSRNHSESNLAGMTLRSASSSSLSSLPSRSSLRTTSNENSVISATSVSEDQPTPLPVLRPRAGHHTESPAQTSMRSKSYDSLASLAGPPVATDGGEEPWQHSVPHYLSQHHQAQLLSGQSMPIPPTVSASSTHTRNPAITNTLTGDSDDDDSNDNDNDGDGDDNDDDINDNEDDDAFGSDDDNAAGTLIPPQSQSFIQLYTQPYQLCSLSLLDAIEPGKNLGHNIAYQHAYTIRKVLSEGYDRLQTAIANTDPNAPSRTGGDSSSVSTIESNPALCELFDGELLRSYTEMQYREHKRKQAGLTSPVNASSQNDGKDDIIEGSAAHTQPQSSPPPQPQPSPVKSSLNPHSVEFVPASEAQSQSQTLSVSPPNTETLVPLLRPSSSVSSLLAMTATTSSTEFDSLDGQYSKIMANLEHARQFETPDINEAELVALMKEILSERGSVPVGRMGSLLHDKTNNHSLPATLKEHYGGLKRLLEKHSDIFLVGHDHPYNPHVRLRQPVLASSLLQSSLSQSHSQSNIAGNANSTPKKKIQRRRTRVRRLGNNSNYSSANNLTLTSQTHSILTPILALDCEMIGVGAGGLRSMLARVSLVNNQLETVYDVFVRPTESVTDYRTHVSGIRPADLDGGLEFQQVQREVASMIKNRLLVGHGLVSDMQALCLNHPRHLLRDTAHFKGLCPVRPVSLRRLVEDRLGVAIQSGEHSPVEDARAAMRLYLGVAQVWEESLAANPKAPHSETNNTVAYHLMT